MPILCFADEAAGGVLTEGAAKVDIALVLPHSLCQRRRAATCPFGRREWRLGPGRRTSRPVARIACFDARLTEGYLTLARFHLIANLRRGQLGNRVKEPLPCHQAPLFPPFRRKFVCMGAPKCPMPSLGKHLGCASACIKLRRSAATRGSVGDAKETGQATEEISHKPPIGNVAEQGIIRTDDHPHSGSFLWILYPFLGSFHLAQTDAAIAGSVPTAGIRASRVSENAL